MSQVKFAKKPTATEILAKMRAAGHNVSRAGAKVNGATAYKIEGFPGLHTIKGMAEKLGYQL
jgi:hypothetical protein